MAEAIEALPAIGAVDAGAWDALVVDDAAPPFYRHAFLAAYEAAPLHRVDGTAYLVARAQGRLTVGVPAYHQRDMDALGVLAERLPGFRPGASGVLSHVWQCYDTRLPARRPNACAGAVLEALRDEARRRAAEWVGFVNVDADTPLGDALAGHGLAPATLEERWLLDLAGARDVQDYLGAIGPKARQSLRRHRRRAGDAGATVAVTGAADGGLDEVARLCAGTAARFGNAGYYRERAVAAFLHALGGLVRVIEVRVDGRLTAAGVCLVDAGRLHSWIAGVRYDLASTFSPYLVMFGEAVRLAIDEGCTILEGGRRNADFKRRHGMVPRTLQAWLARTARGGGG